MFQEMLDKDDEISDLKNRINRPRSPHRDHSGSFLQEVQLRLCLDFYTPELNYSHNRNAPSYTLRPIVNTFLYPPTLKSAGYYVIPSILKTAFECRSICLSVHLYVCLSAHCFHSLLGAFINQFSSNLP